VIQITKTCTVCHAQRQFTGRTAAGVIKAVDASGWYDTSRDTGVCPTCLPGQLEREKVNPPG
jgi:hypothetical protein